MKALSLFSGIGGLDLGAERAGIETVGFCEFAEFPRKVLKKHWPSVPIFPDVKTLDVKLLKSEGIDVESIELIHGGFPCQPYSNAGKLRGKEDDRDLWPEMFRIIKEIKPNWVVGENVANFVNMELDRTLLDLESEGYETTTFVLPACGVDAKHQRYRTFILANANGERCVYSEFEKHATKRGKSTLNNIAADGENEVNGSRWGIEPELGRVVNGIPDRLDRIRGLGNAVVPQQAYMIFKTIMDIEKAC